VLLQLHFLGQQLRISLAMLEQRKGLQSRIASHLGLIKQVGDLKFTQDVELQRSEVVGIG